MAHERPHVMRTRTIAVLFLVCVLGGAVLGGCAPSEPVQSATPEEPEPTVSSAPAGPALPRTARVVASVDRWTLASAEVLGEVGPEVGEADEGSIALGVDAPFVNEETTAASVEVQVVPETDYVFEATVRVMSRTPVEVPAAFQVGQTSIQIPDMDASWRKVTGKYASSAGEASVAVSINVMESLRGLAVDDVKLYAADGGDEGNVIPNGSFERVEVERGIVSSSLVMTTETAAVAVSMPQGETTWEVSQAGKVIAEDAVKDDESTIHAVALVGVPQGLYTLTVNASDGASARTTIALLDSPEPWISQDERYGVGLHVESPTYSDAARYSRALGLGHVRNDVLWSVNERVRGEYDFSSYDAPFAKLRAQGIQTLGIIDYGNLVYGADNEFAPTTAEGLAAYGEYAAEVATRFDLSGVEVFNEFNWPSHNQSGCLTAECYLPLLTAVDAAVAEVDPALPIVGGATAKYQPEWFDQLWQDGGLDFTDVTSFHPYEVTGEPEAVGGLVEQAQASMQEFGEAANPIWLTELGTSSAAGGRTQAEQASVLVRSSISAFASGASRFYWYDLINDGPDDAAHYDNFGLYAHPERGVAALAPKRSGFAQALTIAQLGGRDFYATEDAGAGVVSHVFGTEADAVHVVWAPSGTRTATIPAASPVSVVQSDGAGATLQPVNGAVEIEVGSDPVFVRSGEATVR